jgi:hypothetical protein
VDVITEGGSAACDKVAADTDIAGSPACADIDGGSADMTTDDESAAADAAAVAAACSSAAAATDGGSAAADAALDGNDRQTAVPRR